MSNVSGRVVPIPENVNIKLLNYDIEVSGSNGSISFTLHKDVILKIDNKQLFISNKEESKQSKALTGTYRSLLSNMIYGVTKGYEKKLLVVGVGYKVAVNNSNNLNMNIGFSHPINYQAPEGITITSPSPTEIIIRGADKQKVGQVAAEIRSYRRPEPYKGKGIRYENETIILKETKKK